MSATEVATNRAPNVEFVRIVGAGLVFWYHYAGLWDLIVGARPRGVPFQWLLSRAGSAGVAMFVVLTAMLSYRAVCTDRATEWREFLRRRINRTFPYYWLVAIPLVLVAFSVGSMPPRDFLKVPFWLLGMGFLSPSLLEPVVASWWYMSLFSQLVLVLPAVGWLWRRLGSGGATVLLAAATVVMSPFIYSEFGTIYGKALIATRLLEVLTGLLLGELLFGDAAWQRLVPAVAALTAGLALLQMLVPGQEREAQLLGLSLATSIMLLGRALTLPRIEKCIAALGSLTFGFFLIHGPVVTPAINIARRMGAVGYYVGGVLAIGVTVALTVASRHAYQAIRSLHRARTRLGKA